MDNPRNNYYDLANINNSINNHNEPANMDDTIDSHEIDDCNIDSASTLFVLASSITDLDTVSINSSTTNETTNRAISQTY
ncbi:22579_t:CDS:1, partial [Dentiscutata erythropus]